MGDLIMKPMTVVQMVKYLNDHKNRAIDLKLEQYKKENGFDDLTDKIIKKRQELTERLLNLLDMEDLQMEVAGYKIQIEDVTLSFECKHPELTPYGSWYPIMEKRRQLEKEYDTMVNSIALQGIEDDTVQKLIKEWGLV